jgi:hypothetical protein
LICALPARVSVLPRIILTRAGVFYVIALVAVGLTVLRSLPSSLEIQLLNFS